MVPRQAPLGITIRHCKTNMSAIHAPVPHMTRKSPLPSAHSSSDSCNGNDDTPTPDHDATNIIRFYFVFPGSTSIDIVDRLLHFTPTASVETLIEVTADVTGMRNAQALMTVLWSQASSA